MTEEEFDVLITNVRDAIVEWQDYWLDTDSLIRLFGSVEDAKMKRLKQQFDAMEAQESRKSRF